jgi:hypothetical protein
LFICAKELFDEANFHVLIYLGAVLILETAWSRSTCTNGAPMARLDGGLAQPAPHRSRG